VTREHAGPGHHDDTGVLCRELRLRVDGRSDATVGVVRRSTSRQVDQEGIGACVHDLIRGEWSADDEPPACGRPREPASQAGAIMSRRPKRRQGRQDGAYEVVSACILVQSLPAGIAARRYLLPNPPRPIATVRRIVSALSPATTTPWL